jgi:hypothetical protein
MNKLFMLAIVIFLIVYFIFVLYSDTHSDSNNQIEKFGDSKELDKIIDIFGNFPIQTPTPPKINNIESSRSVESVESGESVESSRSVESVESVESNRSIESDESVISNESKPIRQINENIDKSIIQPIVLNVKNSNELIIPNEKIEIKNAVCVSLEKCNLSKCGNIELFPILSPEFNMREVTKQCLLLEDHLNNKNKRCLDCIRKHFLIIDGLLEEAVGLEQNNKMRDWYRSLYIQWVGLEKEYSTNPTDSVVMDDCSKKIRLFRKPLLEKYFDTVRSY